MKRFLAIVLAAGLIGAAVYVRNTFLGGTGATDPDPGTSAAAQAAAPGAPLRVTCAEDLEAACDALAELDELELTVAPAGATADALLDVAGTVAPLDVWVTGAPWPGLVDALRQSAAPVFGTSDNEVIARSPIGVVLTERGQDDCAGIDWRCLGESELPVALADPSTTVTGLASLGQAAVGWFGGADFQTGRFDGEFRGWLAALASDATSAEAPLERVILTPAGFGAAVVTQADYDATVELSNRLVPPVDYAADLVTVEVVVAVVGDPAEGVDAVEQVVAEALYTAGWQLPDAAPGSVTDDGGGLPNPGVMAALRNAWRDAR